MKNRKKAENLTKTGLKRVKKSLNSKNTVDNSTFLWYYIFECACYAYEKLRRKKWSRIDLMSFIIVLLAL